MGSLPDPGELTQPSFDEFQKQTSLMTSCTLLWKELSDHFNSLEQDLRKKSDDIKHKIQTLDHESKESLGELENREVTIDRSVQIALGKLEQHKEAALLALKKKGSDEDAEVDDSEGLLLNLRNFCLKMDSEGFWRFVTVRKKELDEMRVQVPVALAECIDPARFVLEAISEVFPVDKRVEKSERLNDFGWACVLVLESLIPVVVDPVIGTSRLLVTPSVKERAKKIAETWKTSLDQRGGIENVKTPDVHTFLQHLVTFGIVKKEDVDLYRKLVVGSAWRRQMPKLAVSLGLGEKMADVIEELIGRGQQLDAVHFSYEIGLVDKYPTAPLLKSYLKDAKKAATSILEDLNNSGRALHLAGRKEQTALRAVIKCIEDYKLEAEFPPENLKTHLDQLEKQLEKAKTERKKPGAVPANKRTRANNGGPMPPAKAGRMTNAYVSSFLGIQSPSHGQYPAGISLYQPAPAMYGSRSPPSPYAYSPEASPVYTSSYGGSPYSPEASPVYTGSYGGSPYSPEASPVYTRSYGGSPMNYPAYGGYGAPAYQQAYY